MTTALFLPIVDSHLLLVGANDAIYHRASRVPVLIWWYLLPIFRPMIDAHENARVRKSSK